MAKLPFSEFATLLIDEGLRRRGIVVSIRSPKSEPLSATASSPVIAPSSDKPQIDQGGEPMACVPMLQAG
jgi:hypothetical protein